MTMQKGKVFEYEMFHRRYSGRLAAIVTLNAGGDVAYIMPDGSVQWTEYETMFADDPEALADVSAMSEYVRMQNA